MMILNNFLSNKIETIEESDDKLAKNIKIPLLECDISDEEKKECTDLKGELDIITNQYMSTFNNINELARKFSQGNDNMFRVSMIQKDIEQLEFENGNEYANFIG